MSPNSLDLLTPPPTTGSSEVYERSDSKSSAATTSLRESAAAGGSTSDGGGSGGQKTRPKKKRRSEVEDMLDAAFSMHEVRKAEKDFAQQQQLIAEGSAEPENAKNKRRSLFESFHYDVPKKDEGKERKGKSPKGGRS
jgi:hypothetical protein